MTAALLALLAPDLNEEPRLDAAVQLARRLAGVAEGPEGPFDLDLARAEVAYEAEVRRAALELCERLFHLHLVGLVGPPHGLEAWRAPKGPARTVWLALLELEGRGLQLALPSLPEPGEPVGLVAARLVAAAACLGLDPASQMLWRAHLAAADLGPKTGAGAYRKVLELEGLEFKECEVAHLGYLGCLMARGAVALARDWAEAHLDLAAASPRLMRLTGWIHLAAGDRAAAEEFLSPQPRATLPGPLVALGERRQDLRDVLVGSSGWDSKQPVAACSWTGLRRSDVGAAALCVVQLDDGRPRLTHAELAPGIGRPSEAWLDRQEAAPFEVGEPESELLLGSGTFVGFPDPVGSAAARRLLRGCLSPCCRGLALVPLFPAGGPNSGRLAGWLRLEFEHLLVPEDGRLLGFAAAVGRRLGLGTTRPIPTGGICPRAPELFGEALAKLSLGRRRWWGLVVEKGQLDVLCSEGQALADWVDEPGSRHAVMEVLRLGRPQVQGVEVTLGAGMHRGARAGFVVPLGVPGLRVRLALAVESVRVGDLGPSHARDWMEADRGALGRRLEAAVFDADHRREFGDEIRFPSQPLARPPSELAAPTTSDGAVDLDPWAALGRLEEGPILVTGPPGCGKRTLGRLRGSLVGSRPLEVEARGLVPGKLATLLSAEAVTLRDVEELPASVQTELQRVIEAGGGAGLTMTSRRSPAELGFWTRLAESLRGRSLRLPGLERRRAELPGLFEVGLRRAARRQGCLAPQLSADAEALIWRQTFQGGLHELFDLARRLVPLAHGDELEAAGLRELAGNLGWPLLDKLPTRSASGWDLWQALDGTRKRSGGFHRARAAHLLGWDPDTLAARLAELGWA